MSNKKGNKKKDDQLKMPHGTATGRLRKKILFSLIQQAELDTCFKCKEKINQIEHLSIEHKIPWLDSADPVGLFFDLDNIAFSHLACNIGHEKPWNIGNKGTHGTASRYGRHKCRCELCRKAKSDYKADYNKRRMNKQNATLAQ